MCVCVVYFFCCSVNKQPIDQARRRAMWCAWLVDCLAFDFVALALWRFGGFGAKLGTFKNSKLYHVVAMKLLA
jgi:hypothetical protein